MPLYNKHARTIETIQIEQRSPVEVIDVVPSWDHNTPVRFIVKTAAGVLGYVDMAWSGTNSYSYSRKYAYRFEDLFFRKSSVAAEKTNR